MASVLLRPQASRLLKWAGLAVLTAAIAACAPRQRAPRTPPPEPEPEQVERPSRLPPDETRNRVAVLVPMTGTNAALGRSILNAANLALFDTGGERIRITAYDTSAGAANAANEALADGNGLILGPLLADDARAVAPIARAEGVPVIAFSNDVSVAGNGVYIMGFNPGQSIDRVVNFARSRGAMRFAALIPSGVYGGRAGASLTESVEGSRGQLTAIESYDRTAASLRAAATRLNSRSRHDAILFADAAGTVVQAIPIVRQASPQPRILGTELWANETNIGGNAGLRGAWFAAPSDANYGAFRTRYRARYNTNPYRLATLGYDAVLLASRIAANWPIGRRFPARALTDSTGFSGVDGAFRFGRNGIAERALEVREIGPTGTTVVSPAPRTFE